MGLDDRIVLETRSTSTVEVEDCEALLNAWRMFKGPFSLVGRFIVRKPLTKAQLRRLPGALRALVETPGDSLDFLERLYRLEDPRD